MKSKKHESEREVGKTAKIIRYVLYGAGIAFMGLLLFIGFYTLMGWYVQNNPPEVKTATLPYTLGFDDMRITFEDVSLFKENGVQITLKYANTLHESNSHYFLPGILKFKTNKNNFYEMESYEPDKYFKPEEERVIEGYSQINPKEKPVALVYYKGVWGKYLPVLELRIEGEYIKEETPSGLPAESKIIIKDYNISIDNVDIDKLYLDSVKVLLRNEGNTSAKIDKIVLSSGKSKIEDTSIGSLNSGEEKEFSLPVYHPLEKKIGVEQLKGLINVIDSSGKILAERDIIIPLPIVRIGDTIPEVGADISKHKLSLTLLSWKESDIAVDGPYTSGYYTFTAKPGMKFIILIFEVRNNWIRPQETPDLDAGEIATDKGYIYPVWGPPLGVHSEEYKPRKATEEEIKALIGDSGSYEDLLPEESAKGCVVFEIREDETPIEASIAHMSPLIKFGEGLK